MMQTNQDVSSPPLTSDNRNSAASKLAVLALATALIQSAVLGTYVVAGTLPAWFALGFFIVSGGATAAFFAYCAGEAGRSMPEQYLAPLLLAIMSGVQLAALFIMPKMAIVFLLGLLALYGPVLTRFTPLYAQWGWLLFGAVSGAAVLAARERISFPGTSSLELVLVWLMFFLALRAMISGAADFTSLRNALSEKDKEIQGLTVSLEQLVRHDTLTGALNRRGLTESLEAELLRSHRTGNPFCFAVIDLDHFRLVNEKYGHDIGDVTLKRVSEIAMQLLRALDRFGRIDSEEFGVILPATWLDQSTIAMSRLTKAVTKYDWQQVAPGLTLTFSAGLTTNAMGDTAESIILRAEKALQQAKEQGRNCVVQIEEELPPMPAVDLE